MFYLPITSILSCSYTNSSFASTLSSNWFRLPHLPIVYHTKFFLCMIHRKLVVISKSSQPVMVHLLNCLKTLLCQEAMYGQMLKSKQHTVPLISNFTLVITRLNVALHVSYESCE